MKTTAKHLTTYRNLGLVQLRVEPETNIIFKPGGPELKTGGLIISESTGAGVVGKLIAINSTDNYLLLTDADVFTGAKQNRVMNKSIMLAPLSKTAIDVSCIERLRWQYTSQSFTNPGAVAAPDLRIEKAKSLSVKMNSQQDDKSETQRVVWSHIHDRMSEEGCPSMTESYSDLISYSMGKAATDFPVCEPGNEFNGLAVIIDRKVISIDIFGREEVYRYYFSMLRDSAFRMARHGNKDEYPDHHEACFKVLDAIDGFETAERHPDNGYSGAGSFNTVENTDMVGSELTLESQLVHTAIFAKQS